MSRYVYLIKVSATHNNNKYYEMQQQGNTFKVSFGRVSAKGQTKIYPMTEFDRILTAKLKKGYKDMTEYHIQEKGGTTQGSYKELEAGTVKELCDLLQKRAAQTVQKNYTVQVATVTQSMLDQATRLLVALSQVQSEKESFNKILLKLFAVLPRRMGGKVQQYLARSETDCARILAAEYDLLDIMKGQVLVANIAPGDESNRDQTILEALGLIILPVEEEDCKVIKEALQTESKRFSRAWRVCNIRTERRYTQCLATVGVTEQKLLWHGSKTENWWSILQTGLLLKPDAQITAKMFGNGIYFAPKAAKSLGYTSLKGSYWASGNDNVGYLALFATAYGTPYKPKNMRTNFSGLKWHGLQQLQAGAHCLHAEKGVGSLRNSEIIFYAESQMTIRYLVEVI